MNPHVFAGEIPLIFVLNHFFDISTSKSGPELVCFVHFDFKMCFAPQRRAIFHHSSGQLAPHPPLSVSRLSYLFAHLHLLSSDLSLLSASSLLCFSSVHIVGSLTSKLPSKNHSMVHHSQALFSLPCKKQAVLHVDIREGHVFRVDEDTQVLTDEDLCQHWHEFEVADEAELRQFIQEKAFTKVHKTKVTDDMVVVDCTWVRKFKRMSDGSRKAKSRLCARGFLDPQRYDMPTRSTTATRLSQRLVLSMCTLYNMTMESWDISGAFLKGFSFERVRQLLQRKGISTPVRVVAVVPPANTWRHLAKLDASFAVPEHELDEWLLICEKPIYGLNDAPLAWQLNIHDHLESQGGCQSVLDENLFFWKDKGLTALITTHVDDLAVCANRAFLDQQYKALTVKYGKVSQEKLPFSHCGSRYSSTNTGLRMDQSDFCANLKEVPVANSLNDERDLTKEEQSTLSSQLWRQPDWI